MREKEMERVAVLIRRVALDGVAAGQIAAEVEELLQPFQRVHFSFDP
jgi:hypothetical protein